MHKYGLCYKEFGDSEVAMHVMTHMALDDSEQQIEKSILAMIAFKLCTLKMVSQLVQIMCTSLSQVSHKSTSFVHPLAVLPPISRIQPQEDYTRGPLRNGVILHSHACAELVWRHSIGVE